MLDRLQQRIDLGTLRRRLSATEPATHHVQALAQPVEHMIKRLQAKGRRQPPGRGLERSAGQALAQQVPEHRGRQTVTGQDLSPENGKRASAAAALAAIGTKNPLTTDRLAVGIGGVVAVEKTVPV